MAKKNELDAAEKIRLTEEQQLQQVLGPPPGWMLRWGITVVVFAVLIGIGISIIVQYHDAIPASVTLPVALRP